MVMREKSPLMPFGIEPGTLGEMVTIWKPLVEERDMRASGWFSSWSWIEGEYELGRGRGDWLRLGGNRSVAARSPRRGGL